MREWIAKRLVDYRHSVFDEMNALARRYSAVNLGSGTPDLPLHDAVRTAAVLALETGTNGYSPVRGESVLRAAVAAHAARFYGQSIDPATEVTITSGVTEGIHAALVSFVDPGDEVVVFEPFYDSYVPCIRVAGATPVPVTLQGPHFRFDPCELRAAFSPRTKALILNTPHNPTGIVFSRHELALIAELCQEFDVLAITDEVYEHIVFDGDKHERLATLPGMWERTLTLSGASKTFSCPGWRIGWVIGPSSLQESLCRLRQFTVFAAPTPFQIAVAAGLELPDSYFHRLASDYQIRRDFLMNTLARCGLNPTRPAGGFFILADITGLSASSGRQFCHYLAEALGVVAMPTDSFYLHQNLGSRIARFTFCLRTDTLQIADARLQNLRIAC
jgi:N-succinyldiaminopimelate aminotransferase